MRAEQTAAAVEARAAAAYLAPRINDDGVAVAPPFRVVLAHLGRSDNKTLRLYGSSAEQGLPVCRARAGEGGSEVGWVRGSL